MNTTIDTPLANNNNESKFESLKKAAHLTEIFRAFMECSDELQEHACNMFAVISDKETPEDELQLALMTLADILFPNPDEEDGLLGGDLKRMETLGSRHVPETKAALEKMDREEATFADRLRDAMTKRNITQAELAKLVGVTQPAISMMLQRECRPQRRTIVRIAEALQLDPKELWPGFMEGN